MTEAAGLTGWGDESVRAVPSGERLYLLGAAVVADDEADSVRDALRGLPRTGAKAHYRDDDDARHRKALKVIESVSAQHVVVVASPAAANRPERARAKCLERMFWELEERGVTRYVMEARTQSLNDRDATLVRRLLGTRAIPAGIMYEFGYPSEEPLLWLPDQVLGALGDHEAGDARWFSEALRDKVSRVDLRLI